MLKVYRHILIEKRMEREMNAFAKTDVGIERAVNQDYVYTKLDNICLLYTSPSPRDRTRSRMPSSA